MPEGYRKALRLMKQAEKFHRPVICFVAVSYTHLTAERSCKMGKIAFVFSGQGAQKAGMGKDFYENNASVKELLDRKSVV